jgi:hypothetical protein
MSATFDPPARVGVESTLTLSGDDAAPRAGATVHLVYRPGLPGEHEVPAGLTDARGQLRLTPSEAGTVLVRAGDEVDPAVVAGPPSGWTLAHLVILAVAALWAARRPRPGA